MSEEHYDYELSLAPRWGHATTVMNTDDDLLCFEGLDLYVDDLVYVTGSGEVLRVKAIPGDGLAHITRGLATEPLTIMPGDEILLIGNAAGRSLT